MSKRNERQRRRYAEDPEYRQHVNAANRAWQMANRDKFLASKRNTALKRLYGITIEDYDRMLKKQKGRCAICREKPRRGRLHVDHDHDKKFVRQLLCNPCNRGQGFFRDDVRLLRRAIAGLEAAAKAHRARGRRLRGGSKKGGRGRKRKR